MQSTGIGFDEARWADLPEPAQRAISALGLQKTSYDTGKVLNLLLAARGAGLTWLELPGLVHIGGASFQVAYDQQPLRRGWSALLDWTGLRRRLGRRRFPTMQPAEANWHLSQRDQQRDPTRQYALRLLDALHHGATPPPAVVTGDAEIDQRLQAARARIIELFARQPAA